MNYHLFITLPIYILLHAGLYGVFTKAGEKGWKAFVPVLNVMTWLELVGKPKWYIALFLVPVLNFIMGIGLILDTVRSFGKHKFGAQALAVLFPYLYFPFLGFNKQDEWLGKWSDIKEENEPAKGTIREWLDALLFAGTAALIIRVFLIEAFMIPTTSMEGSLLAGDFLFVSKFHYGVRLPMAPLSVPFVHNSLPLTTGTKSYVEGVEFPYSRLPGFKDVERNEIVVFNYPEDDRYADVPELGTVHITSMKQHYIKRCVAIPGDTFSIRDAQIHINGQPSWHSENVQFAHSVTGIPSYTLGKNEGFRVDPNNDNANVRPSRKDPNVMTVYMSKKRADELRAAYPNAKIDRIRQTYGEMVGANDPNFPKTSFQGIMIDQMRTPLNAKYVMFPKAPQYEEYLWTLDDFGPLWIPKAGATVEINARNIKLYEKIIGWYEGHDLQVQGDRIMIDGEVATDYTFEMDYYFMVGDNRHQSLDSRYWGFVPEDHIVGRPWFVLFSVENGMRWDRLFAPVSRWEP